MIDSLQKRALHRTKILEGQLRGIEKMIEGEEYCMDILMQTLAVQRSLGSLNKLLIENHLRTHVSERLRTDHLSVADETTINELLRLYDIANIRSK